MSAEKLLNSLSLAMDKLQLKGVLQGTVKDVDGYDSCTVEIAAGLELYDVRLNAITGMEGNQVTMKPAVGSKVLVAIIENVKTQAVVIKYGELQEFYIKIGTCEFRIKDSKVKIESEGQNIGALLDDLITEIKKIVVINGRGPNVAALTELALNLKKILD